MEPAHRRYPHSAATVICRGVLVNFIHSGLFRKMKIIAVSCAMSNNTESRLQLMSFGKKLS
jgi:hypothetical protein